MTAKALRSFVAPGLVLGLLVVACPSCSETAHRDTGDAVDAAGDSFAGADLRRRETPQALDLQSGADIAVDDALVELPPVQDVQPEVSDCPAGAVCNPIWIPSLPYQDKRDGAAAPSDEFDYYSPCAPEINESGPEFLYAVQIAEAGMLYAGLDEVEGDSTDMDVHLLYDLDPNACLARGHAKLNYYVEPGLYYIVVDTWVDSSGTEFPGPYTLDVYMKAGSLLPEQAGFNKYVVDAINDWNLYPKDSTYPYCYNNPSCEPDVDIYFGIIHDGYYLGEYLFEGTGKCYCSGHSLEIFLDAYQRWQVDNGVAESVQFGDLTLDDMDLGNFYQYWYGWGVTNVPNAGDAFEYSGIGMNIYQDDWDKALTGDFLMFSRSNGTGHAVMFVNWVMDGDEYVGIRYYGCNGNADSHPDPDDPDNEHGVSGPSFATEYFKDHGGKVLPKYVFLGRAFDPGTL